MPGRKLIFNLPQAQAVKTGDGVVMKEMPPTTLQAAQESDRMIFLFMYTITHLQQAVMP